MVRSLLWIDIVDEIACYRCWQRSSVMLASSIKFYQCDRSLDQAGSPVHQR